MPDELLYSNEGGTTDAAIIRNIEGSVQRVDPIKRTYRRDLRGVEITSVYIDRKLHSKIE